MYSKAWCTYCFKITSLCYNTTRLTPLYNYTWINTFIYLRISFDVGVLQSVSPALRIVGVYQSSTQLSSRKRPVLHPIKVTKHRGVHFGGLHLLKSWNQDLLFLFLLSDPCESFTLVLGHWNQSAIPHSQYWLRVKSARLSAHQGLDCCLICALLTL